MINEAKKLKAIELYAKGHTTCNGWTSPLPYSPTQAELDNYDDAAQIAEDWAGAHPDWAILEEDIDDGSSHDVSSVRLWRCDTVIGTVAIYSYNNNAWGCAEVFVGDDDPGSISDWLQLWDPEDLEPWMRDYLSD